MVGSASGVKEFSQIRVNLPVSFTPEGGLSVANEAIENVARTVLSRTRSKGYVKAERQEIKFLCVMELEEVPTLAFTLKGYQPTTEREAVKLVVRAWQRVCQEALAEPDLTISSRWADGLFIMTRADDEGDYLFVRLPATRRRSGYKVHDWDVKWVAEKLVAHTRARNYTPLKEQSTSRSYTTDEYSGTKRLELTLKGYQPKTIVEAENLIRQAISRRR